MKKTLFTLASVVVITVALASIDSKKESDVLFEANVEALAQTEATATCTFDVVKKNQSKNELICRGDGSLCCKMD